MDAMDNSLERLSMLTTESARAAYLAFAPQLGGSDPQDVKDMLIDRLELPPVEKNYFLGKAGNILLALVGNTCGALVLFDTQLTMTVIQGRNRADPLKFDPKRSNSELLGVLETAGLVRASHGPPKQAVCSSYKCDLCAGVNNGKGFIKHWGCSYASITAPGVTAGEGLVQYPCYLANKGSSTGAGWSNKNTPIILRHILKHLLASRTGGVNARDVESAIRDGEAAVQAMVARQLKVVHHSILPTALHVLSPSEAVLAYRRLNKLLPGPFRVKLCEYN